MEFAFSLRDGSELLASNSMHSQFRLLLPICPACGEPLFLKVRNIPRKTAFWSHFQQLEVVNLISGCPWRIEGSSFQPASRVVPGISPRHYQFVDRFQREVCRDLSKAFGRYSRKLFKFMELSQHELGDRGRTRFLTDIRRYSSLSVIPQRELPDSLIEDVDGARADVVRFLGSQYGLAVLGFLYKCSYLIALTLHRKLITRVLGSQIYEQRGKKTLLVLDEEILSTPAEVLAEEYLTASDPRNVAIFEIAPLLVTHLVLRWKAGSSRVATLLSVAGGEFRPDRPRQFRELSRRSTGPTNALLTHKVRSVPATKTKRRGTWVSTLTFDDPNLSDARKRGVLDRVLEAFPTATVPYPWQFFPTPGFLVNVDRRVVYDAHQITNLGGKVSVRGSSGDIFMVSPGWVKEHHIV